MKAINTYELLMTNKQAVKQEMVDKKVNINVKVLNKEASRGISVLF